MAKKPKIVTVFTSAISKTLLYYGSMAAALAAIITVWHLLGFPTIAWSGDIQRLDRQQTETAIEIYSRAVRGQLAVPAPTDPATKQLWEEELRANRMRLDEATKRRIELGK